MTSSTTYIRVGHNATGVWYSYLVFGHGSSQIGSVSQNSAGNQTLYNQTSDYRLKENIIHLDGAITRIKQLSPRRFNFIGDSDNTVDGFIAHGNDNCCSILEHKLVVHTMKLIAIIILYINR